jgi:hypothetical protein
MATLPTRASIVSGTTTNAQQKVNLGDQRDFLADLLGTDSSNKAAARAALGAIAITDVKQIRSIAASVATNALTLTVNPATLDFRSPTSSSGAINTRTLASPASLVISSGSTLGTTNGTPSRLAVLLIDNAGTLEVAVSNVSGGVDLSEVGLISTTAEGGAGAADSANVVYSVTARSNLPYRVVGYVDSTQATAGSWATAPSVIQGQGGEAFASQASIGQGQTWKNLTASRAIGTVYVNTSGKPMQVSIVGQEVSGNDYAILYVNNIAVAYSGQFGATVTAVTTMTAIVPPFGAYYVANTVGAWSKLYWAELS